MTTLVVLTVVEIVLLIAGLAAYLWIVGTQLTKIAGTLEECDDLVATIEQNASVIGPGVEHINRTGGVIAGALPLLYGMAEGIVAGATYQPSTEDASLGEARVGHPPLPLPRSRRLHPVAGFLGASGCQRPARAKRISLGVAGGAEGAGGRRLVVADPLVLPRGVVLLGVAARPVDRGELTRDLLAM